MHYFLFQEDFEEAVQYFLKAIEISKHEPRYETFQKALGFQCQEVDLICTMFSLSSLILRSKKTECSGAPVKIHNKSNIFTLGNVFELRGYEGSTCCTDVF